MGELSTSQRELWRRLFTMARILRKPFRIDISDAQSWGDDCKANLEALEAHDNIKTEPAENGNVWIKAVRDCYYQTWDEWAGEVLAERWKARRGR